MAFKAQSKPAQIGVGKAFLDELEVYQEPRALLARYFLAANAGLKRQGIELRKVSFDQLAKVFLDNQDSWPSFPPFFDTRYAPVPDHAAAAFVAYNEAGEAIATTAVRVFDFSGTNLKHEIESLRFFYGGGSADRSSRVLCTISGGFAEQLSGQALYAGAYWVRPDYRGCGLGLLVPGLSRYYALARWPVDYKITFGSKTFLAPQIRELYQYEDFNGDFYLEEDGKLVFKGLLLWARTGFMLDRLEPLIRQIQVSESLGGHAEN
jgi:hypothetical protein